MTNPVSYASQMMTWAVYNHNGADAKADPSICQKITSEVTFGGVCLVAVAESALVSIMTVGSLLMYPCDSSHFSKSFTWLQSSLFTAVWSAFNMCINLCAGNMEADEPSARTHLEGAILRRNELGFMGVPSNAALFKPAADQV